MNSSILIFRLKYLLISKNCIEIRDEKLQTGYILQV